MAEIKQQEHKRITNRVIVKPNIENVSAWEMEIFENETAKLTDIMMVLAKHTVNGNGKLLSPELMEEPLCQAIEDLTPEQVKEFKQTTAYKAIKIFKLPALQAASKDFLDGCIVNLDPN